MKIVVSVFLLSGLVFSVPAVATVMVEPDNLNISGGIFSFDLVINDPCGITNALSFQSVINVSGPGTLTLDVSTSQLAQTEADYWLFGEENEGATAEDAGGVNNYRFSDLFSSSPSATPPEELLAGDIMARYAFTWDTDGDYTFTIDLDKAISFVGLDITGSFAKVGLELDPGDDPSIIDSGSDFFIAALPEPATIMLLGLGGTVLLKNRRRKQ